MNWKALVNVIAGVVLPIAFPPLAAATPFIVKGIDIAENMGGSKTEKLQKAIEIANAGAQATNQVHGTNVIDVDSMNAMIAAGISAVVNAANVVQHQQNVPQPFPKAN
jgi:hypothetical protein